VGAVGQTGLRMHAQRSHFLTPGLFIEQRVHVQRGRGIAGSRLLQRLAHNAGEDRQLLLVAFVQIAVEAFAQVADRHARERDDGQGHQQRGDEREFVKEP
jgi:hypothetical protein